MNKSNYSKEFIDFFNSKINILIYSDTIHSVKINQDGELQDVLEEIKHYECRLSLDDSPEDIEFDYSEDLIDIMNNKFLEGGEEAVFEYLKNLK